MNRAAVFARPSGSVLLIAALALVSSLAEAQTVALVPPNIVVPNYDRIPIGQREGLEGNAFVARTDDPAASWYNPAGLGMVKASGVNASANAYEWATLEVEGLGKKSGRSGISSLATLFAAALGKGVLSSDRWRLGLSIARPIVWNPSTIDLQTPVPISEGSDLFTYGSKVNFSTLIPSLNVGFAPHGVGNSPFRLGAGLGWAITSLSSAASIGDRRATSTTATTALRSSYVEGTSNALLANVGVQWDVVPTVTLAARVVSPGIRISGGSLISFSGSTFSSTGSTDLAFLDQKGKFEYKIPLEAVGGVGFRFSKGSAEVDVRYHGKVSPYDMYSSDSLGQLTTVDGSNPPSIVPAPFQATNNSAVSVVNVAVGADYSIAQRMKVNVGFASDNSPVPDDNSTIFRHVNMSRITAGVTFNGEHLSGSVGAGYDFGSGTRTAFATTDDGVPITTQLRIKTLSLLYALSYAF